MVIRGYKALRVQGRPHQAWPTHMGTLGNILTLFTKNFMFGTQQSVANRMYRIWIPIMF